MARLVYRLTCGVLLASTHVPAYAQTSGSVPADAASTKDTSGVTEIVITAQRRSERLEDVPMSITALSADTLSKSGVTSTADLAQLTPGVTMPLFGTWLQPSIRGVTSTGANPGDSANVAMYIDGVYQPQQIATLLDLPDVQQIEVLRGPQGALYGQNATGGAILVTSMTPSYDTAANLSVSYGNYNALNIRGYVTGKVVEGVAFSVAGGFQDRDGFRRHVITGERDRGLNSKVVRAKVLLQPADGVKLTFTGYYSNRIDSAAYAGVPYNNNSVSYALFPTAPRVTSSKQFAANPDVFARIKSYGGSLRAEIDVGAGTINSITGYQKNKASYLADADYGPANFGFASTDDLSGRYFSQEVNFVSEKFGAIRFVGGMFYLTGREKYNTDDFYLSAPNLPPAPVSPVRSFEQSRILEVRKEVIAAYADVTAELTNRLTVTAGGRYTHEKHRGFNSIAFGGGPQPPVTGRPDGPATFSQFTPRITARYEVQSGTNVYASYGKGFKSGLINPTNLLEAPVNPEKIDAYEVGFKSRLRAGFNFNLAAFWYDYKDLQVIAWTGQTYLQQNAATARIKGIEGDLSLAMGSGFSLSAGASYLDARYRDFAGAQVFQPNGTGNTITTLDLSGRRLLRAPKFSGNITLNYEGYHRFGHLGAFVSGYYNSGFGLEPENRVREGQYATVNAEISLRPADVENLRLVVWGKNLTDKSYLSSALLSVLADGVSFAEPRTYGIRAEFHY